MSIKDELTALKKQYKTLETKVVKAEAESGINQKELKEIEKKLKSLTGLDSLDTIDEYIENLEKEIQTKKNVLLDSLGQLETKVAGLKADKLETETPEAQEEKSLNDRLEEI